MLAHLALLRLRPWAALSRAQRRIVWQQFVHPLLNRWPVGIAKSAVLILALLAVMLPSGGYGVGRYIVIFLVVMFTPDLLDVVLVAAYNKRIREYIQEHAAEITVV